MSRANRPHITPGADAALVEACRSFLAATAELDEFSRAGQDDGAVITGRYYAALNALTEALPQSPGAYSAQAVATHLRGRVAKRVLPHETRAEIIDMMAEAAS